MIQSPLFNRAKACGKLLAAAVAAILLGDAALAQTWDRPHADGANNNFVGVVTAPAKKAPITVPGLGKFALGAGPVVARDGTVYLGTVGGKLIALRADGSPLWSRDLPGRPAIVASPCLGANGTVYVVGVRTVRDNRVDPPTEISHSTLYVYTPSGDLLTQMPFPAVKTAERGVAAEAAPNIWRSGSTEVVMAPARYRSRFGNSVRLIAFSAGGGVIANQLVKHIPTSVTGGSGGILPHYNPPDPIVFAPAPRLTNVGVTALGAGGTPLVLVSDQIKDLVAYSFNGQVFTEVFRVEQKDYFLRTPPVILPDARTLLGIQSIERDQNGAEKPSLYSRIQFAGSNSNSVTQTKELDIVYAAPTRLPNGNVAVVGTRGKIAVLQGAQVVSEVQAPGDRSFRARHPGRISSCPLRTLS